LQEIQTFTGGRLAGITAKLTVRPEEATYFDRKEKRKKTSSIWALSLEVEGDDMRKLIANLTENARLFAETRKLLGSGGKVLEVVEDEQEQAPEVAAELFPTSLNGSSATEPTEAASPAETTPGSALLRIDWEDVDQAGLNTTFRILVVNRPMGAGLNAQLRPVRPGASS
jgi:hypothetical protein